MLAAYLGGALVAACVVGGVLLVTLFSVIAQRNDSRYTVAALVEECERLQEELNEARRKLSRRRQPSLPGRIASAVREGGGAGNGLSS